jgi:hypothetical protein
MTFFRKCILLSGLFIGLLHINSQAQRKTSKLPVSVTVAIADKADDKNLILYKPGNNLAIADFKGRPDGNSAGVAATYSGINMVMQGSNKNGVMAAKVLLTIYFDKSNSWMKPEGKTERVLAHEQIHFDLTAMKACALARAIEKGSYTTENVQQKLRDLQAFHTTELNKLQQAYDKETKHGTLPEKQAEWAARVAKELAKVQCM